MNPVFSIRARYVIGLTLLGLVLAFSYSLMENVIERQKNYGRVIEMAGNQSGLSNRIAFFVSQMGMSESEEEFSIARQQVGRAVAAMRQNHVTLLHGDETAGVPKIRTSLLNTIYFDSDFGLDIALSRFLDNADTVYKTPYGDLGMNSAQYVYVTTYGPFVLETLLDAAVTEYRNFSQSEIESLKRMELWVFGAAILLLLVEAAFIFRPLEQKIRTAFQKITESNAALIAAKKHAEAASRSKTEFLAHMSHELRTPLNAVIGLSECLKYGVYGPLATEDQKETISDIHRSGRHLLGLVNDILDLSAVESGSVMLIETMVTPDKIIPSSISHLGRAPEIADVAIEIDLSGPKFDLHADERRTRQVLINLINNAVKYTPKGGQVRVTKIALDDGRAGFLISDTGVGMNQEEIAVAKERFGRVGEVLTHSEDGAGLGLPVAIELMRCHGGSIDIESVKGIGTSVMALFPPSRVIGEIQYDLIEYADDPQEGLAQRPIMGSG